MKQQQRRREQQQPLPQYATRTQTGMAQDPGPHAHAGPGETAPAPLLLLSGSLSNFTLARSEYGETDEAETQSARSFFGHVWVWVCGYKFLLVAFFALLVDPARSSRGRYPAPDLNLKLQTKNQRIQDQANSKTRHERRTGVMVMAQPRTASAKPATSMATSSEKRLSQGRQKADGRRQVTCNRKQG